jgi:hypothetical protein
MKRYDQIIEVINELKPKKILEVGTWNGGRAVRMCVAALKHDLNISYLGFDLFEDADAETDAYELNVKPHNAKQAVQKILEENLPSCTINLVKGNTNETLKGFKGQYDFAFIDGGHSIETIRNDGDNTSHIPFRIFDDYYIPDNQARCPDITKYGCNLYIESLDTSKYEIRILEGADKIRGGGFVQLVNVIKK